MRHVEPIPAFHDNYIWAVHDTRHAIFVDPGEAAPIVAWLQARRIAPLAVLITHHHHDHTGGVAALLDQFPGLPVHGPAEASPLVNSSLCGGEVIHFPEMDLDFEVLAVPGHTLGHLAYHGGGHLFCGDTLFSCGCGRLFEGEATEMHASLQILAALPAATQVCCAHEYTLANLAFALSVEPDNPALLAWQASASHLRARGEPTLPVRLADEQNRNPFLRCNETTVRDYAEREAGKQLASGAAVFAALRAAKDHFRAC